MSQYILKAYQNLEQHIDTRLADSTTHSRLFAYVSANLTRLLPHVSYSTHQTIFKKVLFNLELLTIEEQNPTLFFPHFQINDYESILPKLKTQAFLVCSFHVGAYSLIPTLLTYQNLDFGFLFNQKLATQKGNAFQQAHSILANTLQNTSRMQLINVEESRGIWQAIQLLKSNQSLISYVDGNMGVQKDKENTIEIDFFSEKIFAKQGTVFLSHKYQIPILPCFVERKDELTRIFHLYPAIFSQKNETKEDFTTRSLTYLYGLLEKYIRAQPEEWEGWLFVNKVLPASSALPPNNDQLDFSKENKYHFNRQYFEIIQVNTQNYLFDKQMYRSFLLSDTLHEVLRYFFDYQDVSLLQNGLKIQEHFINISAIKDLIRKNILVQFKENT